MCLICVDFQRDRMTVAEARRALGEMREEMDDAHIAEVGKMLAEAEEAQAEDNP